MKKDNNLQSEKDEDEVFEAIIKTCSIIFIIFGILAVITRILNYIIG